MARDVRRCVCVSVSRDNRAQNIRDFIFPLLCRSQGFVHNFHKMVTVYIYVVLQ